MCSVEGCSDKALCKGLCQKHYARIRRTGSVDLSRKSPEERFWCAVEKTESCWLWRNALHSAGYGKLGIGGRGGKQVYAHRFSYEMHFGAIEEGLIVRHKCDNPRCVNPDHLELGTQRDNVDDMMGRGRNNPRRGKNHPKGALAHCKRGHEFTPENTYTRSNGTRACKQCRAIRDKRNRDA